MTKFMDKFHPSIAKMFAQWLSSVYASVGIPQSGLRGTCNQEERNLVGESFLVIG